MRLIDADAAYERAQVDSRRGVLEDWEFDMIVNCLDSAPTVDVVSVVRCKDCKHWGDHVPFAGKKLGFNWCDKFCNSIAVESDFCSYGELRDGGDPDGR